MNENFTQTIQNISKLLAQDLSEVNHIILNKMISDIPLISQIAHHLISAGGKRIRPLLTILTYHVFSQEKTDKHLLIAACIEFIHTATLLHDDVVDNNESRRSIATCNNLWGNKSSILVGDFLFSKAFELMVSTSSLEILKILSRASSTIAQGEVLQLIELNNINLSLKTYNQIIYAKTASLFSAATQVGALIAKAKPQQVQAMAKYGENLGMIFQIVDDVLDYQSQANVLGKSIGTDFKEGKVTLPIILLLQKCTHAEKEFLIRVFQDMQQNNDDFSILLTYLQKYKIFNQITNLTTEYMESTIQLMQELDINNEYKDLCLTLMTTSAKRIF